MFLLNVLIGAAGVVIAAEVLPAPTRLPHGVDPAWQLAMVVAPAGLTLALT
ncbi:MAG: hypothetical protein M0027_09590 [Candidatus Dormibacteraeota bacterium]|nr:hypothetical protein [Candidatus Dormibacteraeota bacterium]